MELSTAYFDVWLFHRDSEECRYLLLRTSQEKADRWFNGARFWQIPSDKIAGNERIEDAAKRVTESLGLSLRGLWAAEHVYTIYNHRRRDISIIPVFAGVVDNPEGVKLSWEHTEYSWCLGDEALRRVTFRGLREGLASVEEMITSSAEPPAELRLL